MPASLLDDLDAQQRAAVVSSAAPLAIIAPAGSGKTRVLTRRIAYRIAEGAADARHVLALTFTRKAAGELVDRLHRLGIGGPVTAGTFHAVALAELRRRAIEQGREPPRVLDRKHRLLADLLAHRASTATVGASDLAAEIEWAKAREISPAAYEQAARAAGRRPSAPLARVAELFGEYERERRKRRLVDFDDLLRMCTDAITDDAEFAAAERWRFRHLFVDEFQDATPLQLALARAWLGDRTDLCVVGDPAQAIYGFAGADASPLRSFERVFPGGQTIALTRNYRSAAPIVSLAELALGTAGGNRVAPTAVRGEGDAPAFVAYESADAEADAIADQCRRAFTRGVAFHDMAILFRTNAQSSRFERALERRAVPFHVADGGRVTSALGARPLLEQMRTRERDAPSRPFAELLAEIASDETLATNELRAQRDLVLRLGREYIAAEGNGSVAGFAAWIEVAARADTAPPSGVALATFHRAKGLEWPLVFVTGLERGLVPISWATTPEARAEEHRLLHVACSRAEDELQLSWARRRDHATRRAAREPSPWLAGLEAASLATRGVPRDRYSHLDDVRATLATATPPPEKSRRARPLRR